MKTTAPEKIQLVESAVVRPQFADKAISLLSQPSLHVAVLVGVVLVCFGRTLGSYHLADDIGQVKYVSQIWAGHWEMLWSNFIGNYMQIAGMSVFRPTLLMTLVADYGIWHANAFGYYLSNLFYFGGDAVLLYFVLREFANRFGRIRQNFSALAGAALFAASPLHCESISWVVGRVDSACCFFYLSSLLCFLRSRHSNSRVLKAAGVALFWVAITTKEMAIGLPVLLFCIAAINCVSEGNLLRNLRHRLAAGWEFSRAVWISTVFYFMVRFMTLGTLVGGYTGSIGATQGDNALARWLDADSLHRLLFPFAGDLFASGNISARALAGCYATCLALLAVRLLSGGVNWRIAGICVAWAITALVPIYKLWGIGYNLEGARFCFFVSLSLSAFLPMVLLAPSKKLPEKFQWRLDMIAGLAICATVAIFAKTAYVTNLVWVHAGKEVRAVAQSAKELAEQYPDGTKMILLGVPKEHSGAHMILNGDTLKMLLGRPHMDKEIWTRFLTFDPLLFGPSQFVNSDRLHRRVAGPDVVPAAFVWSSGDKQFEKVTFAPVDSHAPDLCFSMPQSGAPRQSISSTAPNAPIMPDIGSPARVAVGEAMPYTDGHAKFSTQDNVLSARAVLQGDGIRLSGKEINPLDYDFLQFDYQAKSEKLVRFSVKWKGLGAKETLLKETEPESVAYRDSAPVSSGKWTTARIRLSKHWRWFVAPTVTELQLLLPLTADIKIRDLRLVSARGVAPVVRSMTAESSVGCVPFSNGMKVNADATRVIGATSFEVQISKCNYFYDNYEEAKEAAAVAATRTYQHTKADVILTDRDMPEDGYYQVRVRALDRQGRPVGEFSDALTIKRN